MQNRKELCLLMMDLDLFKKINDSYGHQAGDLVLCEMAQCLGKVFQNAEIIGRIGGEEFAVVMQNADIIQAFEKAEIFRNRLGLRKIQYGSDCIQVTVSIGIAAFNSGIKSFDELMRLADNALYQAKDQGRNRTAVEKVDSNVLKGNQ
jgi:diguanylate cyclase (GGDEF)-like protein